ncbi:GNAT family N-acetyltransferase [Streptomyces sp. LP11]|uniref:GNAT family N-acetyltransferase n=1 Tax=Streptomyces pyxinicus TaxID=2970331 RepID=A0ABT2B2A1_9ACTN|nr:GNAT family N-acetyltransferase [Streptomyces sp. LP11]MCS0602650.1 GNAT family N-acetyltransferase [Streptomyces sp. LP11]
MPTAEPTPAPPSIRPYRTADRAALADVCVRTAHNGGDSRALYPDPRLLPAIFAEPYCHYDPDLAFVLDDGTGRAVGYIVGTADTERFVEEFRGDWIPRLAGRYPEPTDPPGTKPDTRPDTSRGTTPGTPTEEMIRLLHHPERMLVPELAAYPAHLHIDLLPPWQGRGHGRRLMHAFLDALRLQGVEAVHLGMVTVNTGARAFYDRLGFHEIPVPDAGPLTYLGRATARRRPGADGGVRTG